MKIEALKLALEALEESHPGVRTSFTDAVTYREKVKQAITAIKEALAQPERKWVGLTGEEKALVASVSSDVHDAVHRTNAKLKERNCDSV